MNLESNIPLTFDSMLFPDEKLEGFALSSFSGRPRMIDNLNTTNSSWDIVKQLEYQTLSSDSELVSSIVEAQRKIRSTEEQLERQKLDLVHLLLQHGQSILIEGPPDLDIDVAMMEGLPSVQDLHVQTVHDKDTIIVKCGKARASATLD
ncbi:hypothetical protein F5890DRAFT_1553979 [Lentinula detonsa]|uniref:Uncharacterized protein n=1 Tax=Lentinula detonsa TaxID=2804962 RepID=A0AA38PZP2_9AGAR|nr:hypothetical protein F5890DRAFT_1553979 [Lentinula detonsa]